MDETTTVLEEEIDSGFSVDGIFDTLLDVFGFFRTIIDFLKGLLTPLFEGLFESVLG